MIEDKAGAAERPGKQYLLFFVRIYAEFKRFVFHGSFPLAVFDLANICSAIILSFRHDIFNTYDCFLLSFLSVIRLIIINYANVREVKIK